MDAATAFSGSNVSALYSTRPVHMESTILPPPVSFVLPGTSGFSGSLPLTLIVRAALSPPAPLVSPPPPPPQALVMSATEMPVATQAATRRDRMVVHIFAGAAALGVCGGRGSVPDVW